VGYLPGFGVRTKSKLLTTAHTHSSHYSAPEREQGSRLRTDEEGLGTWLSLGLRIEASTNALAEIVLNLVWLVSLGELVA
jgi:hypothetical protein